MRCCSSTATSVRCNKAIGAITSTPFRMDLEGLWLVFVSAVQQQMKDGSMANSRNCFPLPRCFLSCLSMSIAIGKPTISSRVARDKEKRLLLLLMAIMTSLSSFSVCSRG